MRVIKYYSNRKMYDMQEKRHTSLHELAERVRNRQDFLVIDYKSKKDRTLKTLAEVLHLQLSNGLVVPIDTIKELIRR